MRTIFITSRPEVHQRLALEAAPDELDITLLVSPSSDEAGRVIGEVDPTFLVSERAGEVSAAMIEAGPSLRLIQRLGTQVHDIDLVAAKATGVPVCFWPLPQLAMVAEHVMMQILTLLKRTRPASAVVSEASEEWGPPQRCDANTFGINWASFGGVRQIRGSTVGIIGLGEIGTAVAALLQPFGCSLLYNRRNRLPTSAEARLGVEFANTDELLERSDTVVVLLPHSPETEGSIDASFVARMKPESFLVSSGASTLLDEAAVAAAYLSGHLAGIATDGSRWEPVRPHDPLVLLAADPAANVTLTPHSAQADLVLDVELRRHEFTNLLAILADKPLQNEVTGPHPI
ncbi:MAG: NAD(P)-dependent oxidoreductase [Acidimicrobiales bacterium]